jgi:hypothetical protein
LCVCEGVYVSDVCLVLSNPCVPSVRPFTLFLPRGTFAENLSQLNATMCPILPFLLEGATGKDTYLASQGGKRMRQSSTKCV